MTEELTTSAIKGSTISVIVVIGQFITQIFSQFAFAWYLAPKEFGIYGMSFTIVMLISTLGYLQSDKFLIKIEDNSWDKFDKIFTVQLAWVSVIILAAIYLIPVGAKAFGKEQYIESSLYLLPIVLYDPFSIFRVFLEKNLNFTKAKLPGLFSQIIASLAGLYLAFLGYGVLSLIIWRILQCYLEIFILVVIVGHLPKLKIDKDTALDIFRFSSPIYIGSILVYSYYNVDYIIVESLLDAENLGFYFFAFQLSNFLLRFRTVLNTVLYPIYNKINDTDVRKNWFKNISSIVMMLYLIPCIIFTFVGQELVVFILGEKWINAIIPIKVMLILSAFRAVFGNSTPFLYSLSITKNDIKLAILNSFFVLMMVYVGASIFGLIGASFGLLIGGVLAIYLGTNFVNFKHTKLTFYDLNKKGLLLGFILTFWIIIEMIFIPILSVRIILLGITSFIYAFLFREEINQIHSLSKKRT